MNHSRPVQTAAHEITNAAPFIKSFIQIFLHFGPSGLRLLALALNPLFLVFLPWHENPGDSRPRTGTSKTATNAFAVLGEGILHFHSHERRHNL